MVNYSKWDDIDVSEDEDAKTPCVQRFDGPQSVTFGGGNGISGSARQAADVDDEQSDEPMEASDDDLMARAGEDLREDILQCRALADRALQGGDASEGVRLLEKAMRIGGEGCPGVQDALDSARRLANATAVSAPVATRVDSDLNSKNGGLVEGRYSWSQTKDSLEVNAFVPDATKAKDVVVEVLDNRVRVIANGLSVLEGEWEFKVDPEEDPDWELKTMNGQRVVRLVVWKAKVPGGLTVIVWWKRVLKGDPEIDVGDIGDRKPTANDKFTKAWAEAHVQFREQVKTRRPVVIDA